MTNEASNVHLLVDGQRGRHHNFHPPLDTINLFVIGISYVHIS